MDLNYVDTETKQKLRKKWLDTEIVLENENTVRNNYLCCPVFSRILSYPEPLAAPKQTSSALAPTWCELSSLWDPWSAVRGVGVVVAVQVVVETVA